MLHAHNRFAIISMGRSGSTLMGKLLNSHPDITCLGEVISPNSIYGLEHSRDEIFTFLEETHFKEFTTAGFKMPWDHIVGFPDVWGAFFKGNYQMIFLRRMNKLDQYLSVSLAQKNNNWESRTHYKAQQISLNCSGLLNFIQNAQLIDNVLWAMCQRLSVFCISYEEVLDVSKLFQLQEFLGVKKQSLTFSTVRSRSLRRRDSIINFDEISEALAPTPWVWMLNAEEKNISGV
jgi:LPS sulfotransferase NodH